jgi:hypothetical protein
VIESNSNRAVHESGALKKGTRYQVVLFAQPRKFHLANRRALIAGLPKPKMLRRNNDPKNRVADRG